MTSDSIRAARLQAEKSVADMPEGELKVKAFEVVLHHLLELDSAAHALPIREEGRQAHASKPTGTKVDAGSTVGRILALKAERFFDQPRGLSEIQDELKVHGWIYQLNNLSKPVQQIVRRRLLRRALAQDGNRNVYRYFNP